MQEYGLELVHCILTLTRDPPERKIRPEFRKYYYENKDTVVPETTPPRGHIAAFFQFKAKAKAD